MHRHYIYNKHLVNKLTTLFLYQKSFMNNNIVNKVKCMHSFNNKMVIDNENNQ